MTYAFPKSSELYRVFPFVEPPPVLRGPDLTRTAHHEAGHVVLMEWAGLTPTKAHATEREGAAEWNLEEITTEPDQAGDDTPLAAAHAAAVFHAGIAAELIHVGHRWQGVTARMRSSDWAHARLILSRHVGHSLAGHGYAQRVALAVLTKRWPRVQEIAAELTERGTWSPEQ
ncbi:hypothetical protein [Thauera sp.]|uniref:hypothetical protein n=1 Tax=Thauera sp. TaxID=1905334 RepID=UPI00257C4B8D|nr:hypothetical protein [Thauera sp.]